MNTVDIRWSNGTKANSSRRAILRRILLLGSCMLVLAAVLSFTAADAQAAGDKTVATITVNGTSGTAAGTVTIEAKAEDGSTLFSVVVNIPANTTPSAAYGLMKAALEANADFTNNYKAAFQTFANGSGRKALKIKTRDSQKPKIKEFTSVVGAPGFLPHTTTGQTYPWECPSEKLAMAEPQNVPHEQGATTVVTIRPKVPGELDLTLVSWVYLGDDIEVAGLECVSSDELRLTMTNLSTLAETEIGGFLAYDDESILGCFEIAAYEVPVPAASASWGEVKSLFR